MMTDTGNFAFSHLTPELFRAVAVLLEKGISIPEIHNSVYNAYTEGRARLFGYAINRKMALIETVRWPTCRCSRARCAASSSSRATARAS